MLGECQSLGTNFSEISIKIPIFFIHENAFENISCEMAAILSRGDELTKDAGVITNDGSLQRIIVYSVLCTMHAGETMHCKPCLGADHATIVWWFSQILKPDTPHYSDVIIGAMASQMTGVSIGCSTVCSASDQRLHQSSASLAFVRGIHWWPVNSPHKGPVTRNMFLFDGVIMISPYPGASCGYLIWVYLKKNKRHVVLLVWSMFCFRPCVSTSNVLLYWRVLWQGPTVHWK